MTEPETGPVTRILKEWTAGKREALDLLIPHVRAELRRLAKSHLRHERRDHTLQTWGLVNEAYLRLVDQRDVSWQDRAHFLGVASEMMRRVLVDHARKRRAAKRGALVTQFPLDEARDTPAGDDVDVLALDEALADLATFDPRQSRIVEMKYFGGLKTSEIGEVLKISPATVKREWSVARAWLLRELSRKGRGKA